MWPQCYESFHGICLVSVAWQKMVVDKGADHSDTGSSYQAGRYLLLSGYLICEIGAFITVLPASVGVPVSEHVCVCVLMRILYSSIHSDMKKA